MKILVKCLKRFHDTAFYFEAGKSYLIECKEQDDKLHLEHYQNKEKASLIEILSADQFSLKDGSEIFKTPKMSIKEVDIKEKPKNQPTRRGLESVNENIERKNIE